MSVAKANLERKKGELEVLRRKKGEESLKIETINRRLEYFDDQIELIKKEIEDLPYRIDVLEEQLLGSKAEELAARTLTSLSPAARHSIFPDNRHKIFEGR